MDLIEQLRNQIRGRGDDVLQAIARGVQEDLSRKYLGFEFTTQMRLLSSDGKFWTSPPVSSELKIDVGAYRVELSAYVRPPNVQFVFKCIFEGGRCLLEDVLYFAPRGHARIPIQPIQVFSYEQPDMLEQLYKAIAKLPSVPK